MVQEWQHFVDKVELIRPRLARRAFLKGSMAQMMDKSSSGAEMKKVLGAFDLVMLGTASTASRYIKAGFAAVLETISQQVPLIHPPEIGVYKLWFSSTGIGGIVGAGVFVLTGVAAKELAG